MEMLDPQRFTRGVPIVQRDLRPVMVRRLKSDLMASGEKFPRRIVEPIVLAGLPWEAPELALSRMLTAYGELRDSRIDNLPPHEKAKAKILFIGLQQRLLSSIRAFARTLEAHRKGLEKLIGTSDEPSFAAAPFAFVVRDVEAINEELLLQGDQEADNTAEKMDEVELAEAATVAGAAHATRQQLEDELAAAKARLRS
jgi:hypothetical protein